ncbi:MAG: glutathione S-transferase family protein [Robiginitomaculum sp.]|nr:glutathione S-transferase family protein [Robiginitomaculum sp.]
MLKIYGHFLSMPTNKVRLCASYLGLPHEYVHVDLQTGEHLKPEYLEINAAGRVPAIDDDGFKLSQSDAICKYMCALSGPSSFYPADIKEQAEVNQWIDFSSQHVLQAVARLFFNRVVCKLIGEEPDEASIKTGNNMLARDLPMVEARLADNEFMCGDKFTLADISMAAAIEPAEMANIDLSPYPAIVKWRERMMGREFYRRVHARFAAEMAG